MRRSILFAGLIVIAAVAGFAWLVPKESSLAEQQRILAEVQSGHISQNVPAADEFQTLLNRDLVAYFAGQGMSGPDIRSELLRQGPTQSGVAFPKYYVWVEVVSGGAFKVSGAVRVAAIDRQRFEVTDFVSRDDILKNPENIKRVFPAVLLPKITDMATASPPR